jgi:hypothetical protein
MKKLTSIIAAALTLAACDAKEDPAQQFRNALPKAGAVQVATPADETASAALAASGVTAAAGDTPALKSEYAIMSYYLALTMNTGVGWTLRFLQFVTAFPPTTCGDSSCTWGPWVDDQGLNRWKLEVHKVGGAFEYALSAQPGSTPDAVFARIIYGTAYPVDRDHGSGTFTIDFEAEAGLDHGDLWQQHDFGQIVVDYDNTKDVSIGATFLNARNADPNNPHPLNAVYAFDQGPSGGVLQIAFENRSTYEQWSLRTRWAPGGKGRADAKYDADGGGAATPFYASECWEGASQDFVEVYDSKYPEIGPETACSPFNSAVYADVTLP